MTTPNELDIMAHQALKTGLDSALVDLRLKVEAITDSMRRRDGPMLTTIAIYDFNASMAVVEARIAAYDTEYGHATALSLDLKKQRDELQRKIDSIGKTFKLLENNESETESKTASGSGTGGKKGKK